MEPLTAELIEIFYSLQGEGIYAGMPFTFVRFAGCNLACGYCDTASSRTVPAAFEFRQSLDSEPERFPNPADVSQVAGLIRKTGAAKVSFTGGEPMLKATFIESLLPHLEGLFLLMETNGSLPEKITPELRDRIDHWSVDWKLPSACGFDATGKAREFVGALKGARSVSLKAVFDDTTPENELLEVLKFARESVYVSKDFTLIYQPATAGGEARLSQALKAILPEIEKAGLVVRILPQIHKFLKVP